MENIMVLFLALTFLVDHMKACTLFPYGRGAGRAPDKAPCPPGLRDDGTSYWRDAHIYGKGCCCTAFGCCNKCPPDYHDDGCTCRRTDIGIQMTLSERYTCNDDEELLGALCYPKCKKGFEPRGCCVCEPLSIGDQAVKCLQEMVQGLIPTLLG